MRIKQLSTPLGVFYAKGFLIDCYSSEGYSIVVRLELNFDLVMAGAIEDLQFSDARMFLNDLLAYFFISLEFNFIKLSFNDYLSHESYDLRWDS